MCIRSLRVLALLQILISQSIHIAVWHRYFFNPISLQFLLLSKLDLARRIHARRSVMRARVTGQNCICSHIQIGASLVPSNNLSVFNMQDRVNADAVPLKEYLRCTKGHHTWSVEVPLAGQKPAMRLHNNSILVGARRLKRAHSSRRLEMDLLSVAKGMAAAIQTPAARFTTLKLISRNHYIDLWPLPCSCSLLW